MARRFLENNGYKIIDANVKTSFKEIDLIARRDNCLVFVEVKTRTSAVYGDASEAMFGKKLKNFRQAISLYLGRIKSGYVDIRADFISVDIDRQKKIAKIKHFKDVL